MTIGILTEKGMSYYVHTLPIFAEEKGSQKG